MSAIPLHQRAWQDDPDMSDNEPDFVVDCPLCDCYATWQRVPPGRKERLLCDGECGDVTDDYEVQND